MKKRKKSHSVDEKADKIIRKYAAAEEMPLVDAASELIVAGWVAKQEDALAGRLGLMVKRAVAICCEEATSTVIGRMSEMQESASIERDMILRLLVGILSFNGILTDEEALDCLGGE